jgi:hypothetical protein
MGREILLSLQFLGVNQENWMQLQLLKVSAMAVLMGASMAYGQSSSSSVTSPSSSTSLADAARANREKQGAAKESVKVPVVITTDDLVAQPAASLRADARPMVGSKAVRQVAAEERPVDERAAAQWKKQILAEKDKMASLQARIDQLNATIHPAGTAQFEGPGNRYQTQQQQKVAEIQLQLEAQKRKLTEMQEEARRAGMHTAVYDP